MAFLKKNSNIRSNRTSVWSVADREWFAFLSIILFWSGIWFRFFHKPDPSRFSLMEDVGIIGVYSVTSAFFILETIGAMSLLIRSWKERRELLIEEGRAEGREEGREEGRVEGREEAFGERDRMIRKWLSEEKAKGSEGFREAPPFLNNGSQG